MNHRKKAQMIAMTLVLTSLTLFSSGCESDGQTGALLGAGLGALVGNAIGGDSEATLIGAGIGAGAGYIIGNEEDKKNSREYRYYDNSPSTNQQYRNDDRYDSDRYVRDHHYRDYRYRHHRYRESCDCGTCRNYRRSHRYHPY